MKDFVFPNGNEVEFLTLARELGITELVFVYPFSTLGKNSPVQHSSLSDPSISVSSAILATPEELLRAKQRSSCVLVASSDKNRWVLEHGRPSMVFGYEEFALGGDGMHQRHSGLNQVLCELMNKNEITCGFSFRSLLIASSSARVRLLGRMQQNARLCRKYHVSHTVYSFAEDPYDMRNLKDLRFLLRK